MVFLNFSYLENWGSYASLKFFLSTQTLRPNSDLTRKLGLWSATVEVIYEDAAKRLLQKVLDGVRTLEAHTVK